MSQATDKSQMGDLPRDHVELWGTVGGNLLLEMFDGSSVAPPTTQVTKLLLLASGTCQVEKHNLPVVV